MKKLLVLLTLISLLASCLLACEQEDTDSLRVGMDLRFYPFTGMDSTGKPAGLEVDIAKALGDYLGQEVVLINTEFPMLIPALQNGEIDVVIGSMSITEDREKTVDFSKPYLYDKVVALVNKDYAEKNGIDDDLAVEDFFKIKDTRYIGITGSIAVSIPASYGFNVQAVTSEAVAEREIVTGGADVLVGAYTLYGMHHNNKQTTLMYKRAIEASSIGMAVKEGNHQLLDDINSFIDQMESSGLNDQLRQSWDKALGDKLFDPTINLDYYLNLE